MGSVSALAEAGVPRPKRPLETLAVDKVEMSSADQKHPQILRCKYSCSGVAEELRDWREAFTIDMAKTLCRHSTKDRYSVAILAAGGLLDTLAAIRAGLLPIWGS